MHVSNFVGYSFRLRRDIVRDLDTHFLAIRPNDLTTNNLSQPLQQYMKVTSFCNYSPRIGVGSGYLLICTRVILLLPLTFSVGDF